MTMMFNLFLLLVRYQLRRKLMTASKKYITSCRFEAIKIFGDAFIHHLSYFQHSENASKTPVFLYYLLAI